MRQALSPLIVGVAIGLATYLAGTMLVLPILSQPSFGLSPDTSFGIAVVLTGTVMGLIGVVVRRVFKTT